MVSLLTLELRPQEDRTGCQYSLPSLRTSHMGCSASAPPMEHEQEALLKEKFHYNDDDMSQLYKAFQKIDLTKSNLIEFDEFCVRY